MKSTLEAKAGGLARGLYHHAAGCPRAFCHLHSRAWQQPCASQGLLRPREMPWPACRDKFLRDRHVQTAANLQAVRGAEWEPLSLPLPH